MQDVAAVADRADLMQLGNTVAVLVYTNIRFNIEHLVGCLVSR